MGHELNTRVSFWLMPDEQGNPPFRRIISALAKRFDAPVFDPHVTIYSAAFDARDSVENVVQEVARAFPPLELLPTGVGHSDRFTKTLFIEFASDAVLSRMSEALRRRLTKAEPYELQPHLSLLYAKLPEAERERLARGILAMRAPRFSVVRAIVSRGETHHREDVEAWRTLCQVDLTGPV